MRPLDFQDLITSKGSVAAPNFTRMRKALHKARPASVTMNLQAAAKRGGLLLGPVDRRSETAAPSIRALSPYRHHRCRYRGSEGARSTKLQRLRSRYRNEAWGRSSLDWCGDQTSMTEYAVKIQVSDAQNGEIISSFTTDLRMGADYSWSRGVRWLMQNRMLASK